MSNTLDRRAQAEASLQADALQAANDTLAQRAAQRAAQEQRAQAELDRYLERSMLWQTVPAPEQEHWPVPYAAGNALPAQWAAQWADAEHWPVPGAERLPAPSRVNWPAVAAVGGALLAAPYLVPVAVATAAPAVAALASVAVWLAGGAAALLAARALLAPPAQVSAPEKPARKITVTVTVED